MTSLNSVYAHRLWIVNDSLTVLSHCLDTGMYFCVARAIFGEVGG